MCKGGVWRGMYGGVGGTYVVEVEKGLRLDVGTRKAGCGVEVYEAVE